MEDSRAGKKNDNKTGKRKMFFALLIFILFFPIVFFSALEWFINADFFSVGISGFVQTVIVNVCFGLLAVILAFASVIKSIRPDASLKQKLGRTVIIILCLGAVFFLVRPLVLDIPYIEDPETAYLDRLEFDDEMGVGDSPNRYYLCQRQDHPLHLRIFRRIGKVFRSRLTAMCIPSRRLL